MAIKIEERLKVNPQRTALIIIDMEKAFVEPGAAHCIAGAKSTVPACNVLAEAARAEGIPVFWVKRIYRQDGSDVEHTRFSVWDKGGRPLGPDSTGINSIEEPEGLVRKPEDYVVVKPRWSGFFQTELDLILRRKGIDTLIVIGTTTPNCVRTTCYDAISMDYRTIVVEQCCSSNTKEIQRANMVDMANVGIEIVENWPLEV
ncbi:MAG: cysteine hydrolase [Firmicutes bacterium]|nr:cysteine hydrolase [Bacillota bacterium]